MKKLFVIVVIVAVAGSFCFGVCYGQLEPRIVVQTEYITETIIKEKPVYVIEKTQVIREVEVIKRVEVIKEIPLEVRYFESTIELREWLAQDDTDQVLIMGWDCDDYARALSEQAIKDGYWISIQHRPGHLFNSAIIGNKLYYIEPQHDKFWIACPLD